MKCFAPRLAEDIPLLTLERLAWIVSAEFNDKDVQAAEHPYMKKLRADVQPQMQMFGDVAVIPVEGTLAYNPDPWEMVYYGVEDSRSVLKMFNDAASNPDVRGALVKMDTPGGMMLGGPEIGDAVAAMVKAGKPVVTHIGGLGASLGYMIASQSTEIVASRSAMVGSIGVISSVTDYTKYLEALGIKMEYFTNKEAKFKAAGAVGTSLNEDQRGYIQARVDSAFTVFKDMVSSKRPQVKAETMQGQVFRGEEARALGLVDAVGSEQAAMATLRRHIEKRRPA